MNAPSDRASSLKGRVALIFFLSLPPLILLFLIRRYALNVVCTDDWSEAAGRIDSVMKRGFSLPAIFAPYFDHRPFFPRLATLAMWRLGFGLRNLPGMELDWLLFCGVGAAMLAGFHRASPGRERQSLWCALPVLCWLFSPYFIHVFQTGTYAVFQWTFMFSGVIWTLVFLERSSGLDGWLLLAALSGCLATFSNAAGLMVWPVGVLAKTLIAFLRREGPVRKETAAWALLGAATWGLYFHGWHSSSAEAFQGGLRGEIVYAFLHPGRVALNMMMFWGTPFAMSPLIFAIALLAASAAVYAQAYRARVLGDNALALFFWLFTLATSAEVSVGRAWLGATELQAGGNFYFMALPGLVGLYYLWLAVFERQRAAIAVAFGLLSLLPGRMELVEWKSLRFLHQTMSYSLRDYRDQSDLGLEKAWVFCKTGGETAQMVRDLTPMLERDRLSVFSEPVPVLSPLGSRIEGDGLGEIDEVNGKPYSSASGPATVAPGEGVELMGWAVDARARRAASAVYVSIDGKRDVYASYGQRRRDAAGHIHMPNAVYVGWLASFIPERLGLAPGRHTVSLKIVAADGKGYFQSQTLASFILRPRLTRGAAR